ncbi:hypothetical protein CPB97_004893, partial [Podila verticillata]
AQEALAQAEKERLNQEAQEALAQAEKKRLEQEAQEALAQAEKERLEQEAQEALARAEKKRLEQEAQEALTRVEKEQLDREIREFLEREDQEKLAHEKTEHLNRKIDEFLAQEAQEAKNRRLEEELQKLRMQQAVLARAKNRKKKRGHARRHVQEIGHVQKAHRKPLMRRGHGPHQHIPEAKLKKRQDQQRVERFAKYDRQRQLGEEATLKKQQEMEGMQWEQQECTAREAQKAERRRLNQAAKIIHCKIAAIERAQKARRNSLKHGGHSPPTQNTLEAKLKKRQEQQQVERFAKYDQQRRLGEEAALKKRQEMEHLQREQQERTARAAQEAERRRLNQAAKGILCKITAKEHADQERKKKEEQTTRSFRAIKRRDCKQKEHDQQLARNTEQSRLKAEKERLEHHEKERLRQQEKERLDMEEKERLRQQEKERLEMEEKERLRQQAKERLEIEEKERLRQQEKERLEMEEKERLRQQEKERLEMEEKERLRQQAKERLEMEEKERLRQQEKERLEMEEKEFDQECEEEDAGRLPKKIQLERKENEQATTTTTITTTTTNSSMDNSSNDASSRKIAIPRAKAKLSTATYTALAAPASLTFDSDILASRYTHLNIAPVSRYVLYDCNKNIAYNGIRLRSNDVTGLGLLINHIAIYSTVLIKHIAIRSIRNINYTA